MHRRRFLEQASGLGTLALSTSPCSAAETPDMLLAYIAGKLNALAEKWDRERDKITTAAQVDERNHFVREKLREMVHGLPERTPLRAKVVASHDREGYRVENVMFQSRPDFWVTGNLYVPTTGQGPFPGIISPCGHYPKARMEPQYQFAYLNMVKAGLVVLAYDPIGQGERRQYWNPQTGETEITTDPIYEHSMPGQVLLLMGEDLTHYRIWDGMCAIDYLLTRPEVDPQRIGCAGHSGGGTLTIFISVLDERVRCAVVNEGGTGHRWPVRSRSAGRLGPSDVEQNLFPAAVYGIDICDLLAAIAPRPLLTTIERYSPYFNLAAEHIKKRYAQLGAPEKYATEEAVAPHAWTSKLRLATTDWFCRWFYGRPGPAVEPQFQAEPEATLYCTPNGSLRYSQQGLTIYSLMLKKQQQLPPPRKLPSGAARLAALRAEMLDQIRKLLRYRQAGSPLEVRLLETTPRKGYQLEKLEFVSEPGIYVPTWVFIPQKRNNRAPAILYVHEAGKEKLGQESGLFEKLALGGGLVIAVDVRRLRATGSSEDSKVKGFGHLFNAETALAYMTWFMDECLFGMRVQDVVRSVEYALSREDVNQKNLRVVGKGAGALWVLYAAALDPRISDVVADGGLVSYRSLAQVDRYLHGAHLFIRDVLLHFDLPQVAATVANRKLALVSPVDPMMKPLSAAAARQAYRWTAEIYARAGAAGHFRILTRALDLLAPA